MAGKIKVGKGNNARKRHLNSLLKNAAKNRNGLTGQYGTTAVNYEVDKVLIQQTETIIEEDSEFLEREVWNIVGEDEDVDDLLVDESDDIVSNEELLQHENDILKLNSISHDTPFAGFGNSKRTKERNITKKGSCRHLPVDQVKVIHFFHVWLQL